MTIDVSLSALLLAGNRQHTSSQLPYHFSSKMCTVWPDAEINRSFRMSCGTVNSALTTVISLLSCILTAS